MAIDDTYVTATSESSSSVGESNAPALSADSVEVNFKAYTTVGLGHASLSVPGCGCFRTTVTYQHFSIHAKRSARKKRAATSVRLGNHTSAPT